MKKIFTLISMAFMAMSANAQDVYNAIVDGKLAPEFSAVAGDNGGKANNAADGKRTVLYGRPSEFYRKLERLHDAYGIYAKSPDACLRTVSLRQRFL